MTASMNNKGDARMGKYRVVMIGKLMPPAQQRLLEHCDVRIWENNEPIPADLIAEWLRDAEGLVSSWNIEVNKQLLALAPQLKVIVQPAVGYDNIDIDACTKRGIPFGNTRGVLVEATADLAFALLLCSARRIHEGWDFVRQGNWKAGKSLAFGIDLYGKTLGIVGMGQIGAAVARRAKAFGMDVIYFNRNRRKDEQELGVAYAMFDELLGRADCIIVLTPLSPETRAMFGHEEFRKMKSTAFFVNAARGPLVDTEALIDALMTNKIAYAALDVTNPEPLPWDHPLLKFPNVLITPHIGSATIETRTCMSQLTVDNLLAGLAKQPLLSCVNQAVNYG
jgi:glyoxylate reductase